MEKKYAASNMLVIQLSEGKDGDGSKPGIDGLLITAIRAAQTLRKKTTRKPQAWICSLQRVLRFRENLGNSVKALELIILHNKATII